jgi:hypothetical protein
MSTHDAVDAIPIGEREAAKPESDGSIDELFWMRGTLEKGEVGATDELGVVGVGSAMLEHLFSIPRSDCDALRP